MTCANGDGKPAARRGLCWACIKCIARNGSTIRKLPQCGTRYETPEEMLNEATIRLSEARDGTREDRAKAFQRYLIAHLRYRRMRKKKTVHTRPDD